MIKAMQSTDYYDGCRDVLLLLTKDQATMDLQNYEQVRDLIDASEDESIRARQVILRRRSEP